MAIKTFTGETMQEAMNRVKAELGDDALIISSKEIKKKTLSSKGLYEVVAQVDDTYHKPKESQRNKNNNDVLLKLSKAAKKINDIKIEEYNAKLNSPAGSILEVKQLQKEVQEIANNVKLLQATIWDMNAPKRDSIVLPPEFSEIYAVAKNSGIHKPHLDEIMELTLKHMPLKMRQNTTTIKRYFNTLLRKMVPVRVEKEPKASIKQIMMFVGPTGVGKTTTIAKLAARYAFQKKRKYKVGIITLDTYRIGAVEQLMTYARMMKLAIEAVVDPSDFVQALERLKNNDIILIDTVGSSQHDKEKVDKLNKFLSVDTFASIDVNLVLSATTKFDDLQDIYDNFSILPIDTVVFTKLDETMKIGNIFSLIYETKKPISYFSIGQEVPDDLIVASNDYLVENMLKDIK